ncbi:MAG TPA: hypothetical protein VF135_05630 [Terriglobales bacterium]
MELLERYLQAVKKYLPKKKRDDIAAELRANLQEQAEEKESELGRPLTVEEEEDILRQHGHPMLVATRYLPKQHLIGPTVFPYYWFVLKTAVPLALLAYTVVMSLTFATQTVTLGKVLGMLANLPQIAVSAAVWITVVFVIMDFAQAKYVKNCNTLYAWSPRNLPPLERDEKSSKNVFEVIFGGIGLIWFLVLPSLPFLVIGPANTLLHYMQPAPLCITLYWVFVGVLACQWLSDIVALFNSAVRRIRREIGLLGQGIITILFCILVRSDEYLVLTDAGLAMQKYQALVPQLNAALGVALKLTTMVLIVTFCFKLGALVMKRSHSNPIMVEKH